MHSLPVFLRLSGRPVILLGDGDTADAKRRLLARAGTRVVGEDDADARIAIVALDDRAAQDAAAARLRARGLLLNVVDRPDLCDFTLPAIVDRDPVLIAIGTGGASAGLAAALRQRLEGLLPTRLGKLASDLFTARAAIKARWPESGDRRRALADALSAGGPLDPLGDATDVEQWIASGVGPRSETYRLSLRSADPDLLTLRDARMLASADRIVHPPATPPAILDRARADAARLVHTPGEALPPIPGLTVIIDITAL